MECNEIELEAVKKEITKCRENKDSYRREVYNMADKKMELESDYWSEDNYTRLHQHNIGLVHKIFRLKSKRKGKEAEPSLNRNLHFSYR